MQRRDVLRLLALSTLAVSGGSVLAACGADGPGGRRATPDVAVDGVEPVSSDVERAPGDDAAVPILVEAVHRTGGGIYGTVAATPGNVAISPYSIAVAMGLVLNGARGRTRTEIASLYGDLGVEKANGALNSLTTDIEALAGPVKRADGSEAELALDAANALFGQLDEAWEPEFLEVLAREYGAGMQTVDYAGDVEAARAAINAWTSAHTHELIPEIIPPDVLDELTRLVAVNALYLKAAWEHPFDKGSTADADFTRLDGTVVSTPTMSTSEPLDVPYAQGDGWQAVQLPYAGGGVAMTVVLPDDGAFERIEADVAAGGLPTYVGAVKPASLQLRLPSWTFRTETGLREALETLGVRTAFEDGQADFSGITQQESLHLTAVLHQVFISVDEDGTEAAAATAAVIGLTSAPAPGIELVVDRAFLFAIHDVEHGTPLFLGRVTDPTEE